MELGFDSRFSETNCVETRTFPRESRDKAYVDLLMSTRWNSRVSLPREYLETGVAQVIVAFFKIYQTQHGGARGGAVSPRPHVSLRFVFHHVVSIEFFHKSSPIFGHDSIGVAEREPRSPAYKKATRDLSRDRPYSSTKALVYDTLCCVAKFKNKNPSN